MPKLYFLLFLSLIAGLAACGAETPPPATPTETPATPTPVATCADLDATWGRDWPAVLETLDRLIAADQRCGDEPLLSKKYAVHFNYGAALETEQKLDQAISQYRAALFIDPQRREALAALVRLEALPKPTPPACLSTAAPRPDPAPADPPDPARFVTVQGEGLYLDGRPFTVKGVNYYPRQAPWHRFLTESDPAQMAEELDLIKEAGFNTLRIFLWYEPLFTCRPEDAIPNEAAFALVDSLFELAGQRDLKLIVTLNDLPDLIFRPLYTDWDHYDAQTVYVVRRYRNHPELLAWDLRNEGDLDYGADSADDPRFSQEEVLAWLDHAGQLVRENDPHHLLTAGWWGDPGVTDPYVDILSFHHWTGAKELEERIEQYRQQSNKPLMLQEVGYHSWPDSSNRLESERNQAKSLGNVIEAADKRQGLSGWIIWTAFDFVPPSGRPVNEEYFFGLWRTDLTPKPALEALPLRL